MPLGQGWLNAWVKVNSKHVVFPSNKKGERENHDVLGASKSQPTKRGTNGSVTTASTAISDDVETQAIRRFNNRKHKRRLQRTVSASDLVREMAKGKGDKKAVVDVAAEAVLDKSSTSEANSHRTGAGSDKTPKASVSRPQHEHGVVSMDTDDSLRFVAGFFGADIESLETPAAHAHFQNDHFDSASVRLPTRNHTDAASITSRGGQSLPARHYQPAAILPCSDSDGGASRGNGFRFPQNLFAGDNHSNSKKTCKLCTKLESELVSAREDLEYLRNVALRSEYTCASCQTEPSNRASSAIPNEGSELISEITERHRVQITELNKIRDRFEHDMGVKLQKYSSICTDLNEEAALRNEEAISLHKQLDEVRSERNKMATELEETTAKLAMFERNERERVKAEQMIRQYEQNGLDGADKAIKTRDSIIADLAGRLERALDCLELEREQQRQRRQIIFPTQRNSQSVDGRACEENDAELKAMKDSLRNCQTEMESLKRETERKELAWTIRMESLERQLEAARAS